MLSGLEPCARKSHHVGFTFYKSRKLIRYSNFELIASNLLLLVRLLKIQHHVMWTLIWLSGSAGKMGRGLAR